MALFSYRMQVMSRSKGHNACAAAAYRAGEKIYCERTGQTFDYRNRTGVLDKFILTPDQAEAWTRDRSQLWNKTEWAEDRSTRPDQAQLLSFVLVLIVSVVMRMEMLTARKGIALALAAGCIWMMSVVPGA